MHTLMMARDTNGDVVVGELAGGAPGVIRLVNVTRSIDPRKPWEQSAEEEAELLVDASTVESLC
jgi:hypothetical protein